MRAGRIAVVTLVGLITVSLLLPAAASAVIGGRLAPRIAEQFGVQEDDVSLDLALSPIWDLVRGRIGDVGVQVSGYEATTAEGPILIDPLGVALLDVEVSLGAALSNSVEEVRFGEGLVFARLPFETLTPLLRPRMERQGIELRELAGGEEGTLLVRGAIAGVPDSEFVVRAELEVADGVVRLGRTEVVEGRQEAKALVDAADLRIETPELPAGIVLDAAGTDDGAVRVRGTIPGPLVLALLA